MLAVIKSGGKQYLVSPGDKIKVEKIDAEEGKEISFPEVLLTEKKNKIQIGTPFIKGAKVIGKILKHDRTKKIIVFKYKSKTRRKSKKGHRQDFTEVEITKIED